MAEGVLEHVVNGNSTDMSTQVDGLAAGRVRTICAC